MLIQPQLLLLSPLYRVPKSIDKGGVWTINFVKTTGNRGAKIFWYRSNQFIFSVQSPSWKFLDTIYTMYMFKPWSYHKLHSYYLTQLPFPPNSFVSKFTLQQEAEEAISDLQSGGWEISKINFLSHFNNYYLQKKKLKVSMNYRIIN